MRLDGAGGMPRLGRVPESETARRRPAAAGRARGAMSLEGKM